MNHPSGLRGLWRHFAFWFEGSIFLAPFLFAWMNAAIFSSFIPYRPDGEFSWLNFMIVLGIALVNLHFMRKLTRAEVAAAREEFLNDPEYLRIQELIANLKRGGVIDTDGEEGVRPTEETSEQEQGKDTNDINN